MEIVFKSVNIGSVNISVFLPSRIDQTNRCRDRSKYNNLDLARERKKLWNLKMTVIPIVTGLLGAINKG